MRQVQAQARSATSLEHIPTHMATSDDFAREAWRFGADGTKASAAVGKAFASAGAKHADTKSDKAAGITDKREKELKEGWKRVTGFGWELVQDQKGVRREPDDVDDLDDNELKL